MHTCSVEVLFVPLSVIFLTDSSDGTFFVNRSPVFDLIYKLFYLLLLFHFVMFQLNFILLQKLNEKFSNAQNVLKINN